LHDKVKSNEMKEHVFKSKSYNDALSIIDEYVDLVEEDDEEC
jgi:hypothetical protein